MHAIPTDTLHHRDDRALGVEGQPHPQRPAVGEVHIWFSTEPGGDADATAVDAIDVLDEWERVRAGRFRAERDRARFVAHHVFTRRVLAAYLGIAPADVPIRTPITGKPETDPASGIAFNTSHSGGLSVVAVACDPVGVDIEQIRPIDDALEVADGLFADGELRQLRRLPRADRSDAFLALWTRKESVVKALGHGLSQPLDVFDVADGNEDASGRWHPRLGATVLAVARLDAPSGWVGAVSIVGRQLDVHHVTSTVLPS